MHRNSLQILIATRRKVTRYLLLVAKSLVTTKVPQFKLAQRSLIRIIVPREVPSPL